ncbi:unnamed protein product, partial [Ectocarpus sp. 6 AP-2014]
RQTFVFLINDHLLKNGTGGVSCIETNNNSSIPSKFPKYTTCQVERNDSSSRTDKSSTHKLLETAAAAATTAAEK